MAFSQAYESVSAPQRAIGNGQHVQEVGVTTGIPAPSLPGLHEDHDVRAPSGSTRAPAERPKPSWLLPARPIPNRPAFSSSVSTSLDINRRPTLRKDFARACAPQEPPCVPQTAQPPLHDASSSISASASIALAVSLPPGERAGKRKAAEEVPGRAAAAARMLIGVDESSKIMRSSLAAVLVQSRGRRVTVAGGEACDAGHPKRARRATSAAPSDDDDDTDKLSWKRKIRPSELPAASSSVSGIKGKGVCATSAASGVTHIPRPTAPAANSNSCGPGLGVVNQEVPSGLRDGTPRFSEPRGVAPLGETAAPPQETSRGDAEPATTSPTSGDEMVDETQPMKNAQPMEWAPVSSSVEWTTGSTGLEMPGVSAPLPARPLSEERGFSGDLSDLTPQGDDPSELMDDGSSSSSDVPLFSLVYPLRGARKRALPAEEPLHSKKGKGKGKSKGKGKAKTRASESKDGSSYVEDSEKGASTDTDVDIFVPRPTSAIPATAQYSSSKGKNAKVKTPARISHIEGNTRNTSTSPRKRFRAQSHHTSDEDISDTDVVPQARPARNNRLRTKSPWRVVEPPKSRACPTQRLAAPSSRPRVWAGSKDELLAALPALAKNKDGIAWENLEYPTLIFSGERGDAGLGWWDKDAWASRRIVFSVIRETEVPLADPPDQPSVSNAQNSTPDGGHTIADTQPPPENPSNPLFDDDGASHMVPNSKTSASSSGEKDPPRIGVESPTGATPSQLVGPMNVPSSGLDRSPSILEPELRCDRDRCTNVGGQLATSSMPCGAGVTPDGCPPSDCPAAEATRVDGPPCFDTQISLVHSRANGPTPGGVSACDPECDFSESRGAELSCPTPLSTREHPIGHSSQAGPVCPDPSESAHPSAILPQYRAAPNPVATPSCSVSVPPGSEKLPFPRPPPEVSALLTTLSLGNVVSPVLARNSPLVPWDLPSEIGYFWLGLFRVSEVKVETLQWQSNNSKALTVQRTWRFSLEWVAGGEDQLKDDEQGTDDEWSARTMRPWWEPEDPQQPDQHPLFVPSQNASAASPMPESRHDATVTITGLIPRYSRLLLPLPLLAPFTENSTAIGNFPAGYYCTVCGRINVQRFLRHRICESSACNSRTDPQRETGWVISAFSTRDRKVNSATVVPDDKWAAPTTAEPATAFDDGARLFHYHLAVGDSGPSAAPSNLRPPGSGADVRHVFNGNRELLQGDASALFETLQRDVRIERSIGASVFSTPQIESGDDPALGRNGRRVWDQHAVFVESALNTYCRDLGPLKVRALRVHAWISDGKHIQTFCPRAKHLVLLCLGADIALLSVPSDPNVMSSNGKPRKECLRVTMVHGDIVVLSGPHFKFSTIRTGMCMLLEAECI